MYLANVITLACYQESTAAWYTAAKARAGKEAKLILPKEEGTVREEINVMNEVADPELKEFPTDMNSMEITLEDFNEARNEDEEDPEFFPDNDFDLAF